MGFLYKLIVEQFINKIKDYENNQPKRTGSNRF